MRELDERNGGRWRRGDAHIKQEEQDRLPHLIEYKVWRVADRFSVPYCFPDSGRMLLVLNSRKTCSGVVAASIFRSCNHNYPAFRRAGALALIAKIDGEKLAVCWPCMG